MNAGPGHPRYVRLRLTARCARGLALDQQRIEEAMSLRVAVLLSGEGTTFENLVRERDAGRLDVELALVVSSRAGAGGLERARRAGVPARVVERRAFADDKSFNDALHAVLDEYRPGLVALAGFMCKLETRGYAGRVINVHPALIPAFCGKGYYGERVHRAVLESGVKITGATVHFCDDEYDTGPIILQAAVPVEEGDTPHSLAERVQAAERELYPRAIRLFAEGRLEIEGRRVRIR
jgi:phosphoribosylglycinamide formyltransferase-1